MKPDKQNILTIALCATYVLLLTGVILFKLPFYFNLAEELRVVNLIPFRGSFDKNGALLLREMVQNALIFVPLGIYISMLKSEWPFVKKVVPIIGLSLAFEIIQFVFAIGRSDITDVINNTLGGLAGIAAYAVLFRLFKDRTARLVNLLALVITVYIVCQFGYFFYLSHFVMRRPQG